MGEKKDELIKIVGTDNVLDDPETLEAYSRDNSFVAPRKPRFVVKPETEDEIQKIVKWANQTLTPLVPVSSGPPRFRGDTVPSLGGAVIVDLSERKQIIKIDGRNRVAIVEPGVTYGQLQPELAKEGLRIPTPLLPRSSKSVVGSALEREPHLIPKYQWSLTEPLRVVRVVWGNGDIMTSGALMAYAPEVAIDAGPVFPLGPAQVDYYRIVQAAQGSMGIVTWASVGCEVLPQLQKLFFVPSQRLDDLIGFAHRLLKFRYGDEFLILNNSALAYILDEGGDQNGALREELPPWVLILCVAGYEYLPEERVEVQEKDIMGIAQQFSVKLVSAVPGASSGEVLEILRQPSKEPYWKLRYRGGCQDIFFLTTLNRTPEFVNTVSSVAQQQGYSPSQIGIYIQPQHQGVCCHCEFSLPFDPGNPKEATKTQEFFTKASGVLINQGAFFSRPYGPWANMVYNRDAHSTAILKKIKGIFDPNNVMNPGKLCF